MKKTLVLKNWILPVALAITLGPLACSKTETVVSVSAPTPGEVVAPALEKEVIRYPFTVSSTDPLRALEKIEKIYETRIEQEPNAGLPLASLASVYTAKAKLTSVMSLFDEAEVLAEKSLKNLPYSNYAAKLVLVSVAEARHDFPKAIRLIEEVLKEDPANEGAVFAMITSSIGFGKLDQAAKFADLIYQRLPLIGAGTLKAQIHEATGNEHEAEKYYLKAIRAEDLNQHFDSAWTRTFLGRLHMNRGRYELALAYFTEAIRILPNCHLAMALKGELQERNGNLGDAEKYYASAFNAMGEPPYLLKHARMKFKMGDKTGAATLRTQAEKLIRDEMATGPYGHHNELARLLIDRSEGNDLQEAVKEAEKDVEMRQSAQAYALLAEAYFKSNRFREAKTAMDSALKSGIEDAEIFSLAAQIETALNDHARASYFKAKSVETNPRFIQNK